MAKYTMLSYHLCVINKIECIIKGCIDGGIKTSNTVIQFLIGNKGKHNTNARKININTLKESLAKLNETYNNRQTQMTSNI